MAQTNLLVDRPTTLKELNAVLAFEQENKIEPSQINGNFGDLKKELYLMEGFNVIDSCYIEGASDMRSCILSFPTLKDEKSIMHQREIVLLATDYAFFVMQMKESFVFTEDESIINTLKKKGYESLGKEGEKETFIKDIELMKEREEIKWR